MLRLLDEKKKKKEIWIFYFRKREWEANKNSLYKKSKEWDIGEKKISIFHEMYINFKYVPKFVSKKNLSSKLKFVKVHSRRIESLSLPQKFQPTISHPKNKSELSSTMHTSNSNRLPKKLLDSLFRHYCTHPRAGGTGSSRNFHEDYTRPVDVSTRILINIRTREKIAPCNYDAEETLDAWEQFLLRLLPVCPRRFRIIVPLINHSTITATRVRADVTSSIVARGRV